MRRWAGLSVAVLLSVSFAAAAPAAPAPKPEKAKYERGLKNARKALQAKRERYEKIQTRKKQGKLARQQAASGKSPANEERVQLQ